MIHYIHMPNPRVTVIMPSFNASQFISEAIDAVIEQTFRNWELLIVDDASADGTTNLAHDYQCSDDRIRLIAEKTNRGPAYARNVGLRQARGDFIAFLDSDDVWLPNKLQKQVAAMDLHNADISYTVGALASALEGLFPFPTH